MTSVTIYARYKYSPHTYFILMPMPINRFPDRGKSREIRSNVIWMVVVVVVVVVVVLICDLW